MKRLLWNIMTDIPISQKLMILIMLTCGVTLITVSAIFVGHDLNSTRTFQREELSSLADVIAKNSAAALVFNDAEAARETLATLKERSDIVAAYLVDHDGTIFARYLASGKETASLPLERLGKAPTPAAIAATLRRIQAEEAHPLNVVSLGTLVKAVNHTGQPVGTVVLHSEMTRFLDHLYWTLIIALFIMAGAFVLAWFISFRLQHLISAPILSLADTMREVSQTKNFGLRAHKISNDEIGLLFDGFNEMLYEIEERNQTLRQRHEHLQQLAHYDTLTRLPNRMLFYDRLKQALHRAERAKESVAVLFIDLDRFKDINDTLGHRTGDLLLVEVARRLNSVVRSCDTVARLGGDEFTIFAQNIGGPGNAALVARKIQSLFAPPFLLEGRDIFVTASIGITLFPADGSTVDELLMNADLAMYCAKGRGKNYFELYDEGMKDGANERVSLQTDLRLALEREEFLLHYQPKVDLASGRITSVEALVRWNHPDLGVVPPMKFIPLAEETGFIVQLTEWVLRTAARQVQQWQAEHPGLTVAVNLSPCHFKRGVVQSVCRVLEETGADPALLDLEITESSLMESDDTIESLQKLKQLGVSISLDDFGTGYSSLSYLHRFPIDSLKIDRSFIWNMSKSDNDEALVTAIIAMARSLKMRVVAEGVETPEQLAGLHKQGCHEIQGYLISPPLPADELEEMLGRRYHGEPDADPADGEGGFPGRRQRPSWTGGVSHYPVTLAGVRVSTSAASQGADRSGRIIPKPASYL